MEFLDLLDDFLKQTIQTRDLLLACGLFAIPLAKRPHLWLKLALGLPASLALSYFIPHSTFSYLLELLVVIALVWLCCGLPVTDAIYCGVCGYACQHIAYAVYSIIRALLPGVSWENPPGLSLAYFTIYPTVFVLLYLLFGRHLASGGRYDVDIHQTLFSSIGTLAVVWLLSTVAQTLALGNPGITIVCHLYGIFCCVSMFWGQVNQRNRSRLERELVVQQQLARQQREQYQLTQETIDIINRKCHDLKHQVAALRNISLEEQREAHLSEIERSIQIYDSTLETGSRVLDTVLTEKSLYCGAHQITMTCMADGRRLSFLDDVDVYTIFGNAIDNAIESVSGLTDPEKRAIAVSVWSKSGLLLIQFENYYEKELRFENGIPATTKADKNDHGFGIRSIGYTVKKYGGHLTISAEDHLFLLSISIPLP